MIEMVLSACVLGVGDAEETTVTTESVRAAGLRCRTIALPLDGPSAGPDFPEIATDATPAEMIQVALAVSDTPWVLVLVAGETFHVPDGDGLEATLDRAEGSFSPWLVIDECLIPDPLLLPGARILSRTAGRVGGNWSLSEDLFPATRHAPFVLKRRRSPFVSGSPSSRWALNVANRLMLGHSDLPVAPAECLLESCLLLWGDEMEGALSSLRRLPATGVDAPADNVIAGRIQLVAGLATGRDQEAADGLNRWKSAQPGDVEAHFWACLFNEMMGDANRPAGLPRLDELVSDQASSVPSSSKSMDLWLDRTIRGRSATRWRVAEYQVNFFFSHLKMWSASPPAPAASQATCAALVEEWRKLGRPASELIARWPANLLGLLIEYLETTPKVVDPGYWLALALVCTETEPLSTELLRRAELLQSYLSVPDALTWTLRAKAAGHPELSPLRYRANNQALMPRERAFAAALAIHHAQDRSCEAALRQAAQSCAPNDFLPMLSDFSRVAASALPLFIEAVSTSDERAAAMVQAVESLGILGAGGSDGGSAGNRAQRRAAARNRS